MNTKILLMGIILWMLSPFLLYGQLADPVSFEIRDIPTEVEAGAVFEVEVEAGIEPDWYLYSVNVDPDAGPYSTRFAAVGDQMLIAGEVLESDPVIKYDPNFDTELGLHSNQVLFTIPVALSPELRGEQPVEIEVLYQACDDISCLPPTTKSVSSVVMVQSVSDNIFPGFDEHRSDLSEQTSISGEANEEKNISKIGWILIALLLVVSFALLIWRLRYMNSADIEYNSE